MDVLSEKQKVEYLAKLIDLTNQDRVPWGPSNVADESDEYSFYAVLGQTAVWIWSNDRDDLHPYTFTIDEHESDMDPDKAKEYVRVVSDPDDRGEMNDLLKELYTTVKRRVLGLDTLPDKLFGDLDTL